MTKRLQGIDLRLDLPRCEDVLAAWVPQNEDVVIPLIRRRAPARARTLPGCCAPTAASEVEDPIEPTGWLTD